MREPGQAAARTAPWARDGSGGPAAIRQSDICPGAAAVDVSTASLRRDHDLIEKGFDCKLG